VINLPAFYLSCQLSFKGLIVARAANIAPEVPIKPIPTIPITLAMPVWFSPKTILKSTA
jgi:hypothetical protein